MTREKEDELLKQAKNGSADAFEQLMLEHQKKVYNLALRMTGSEEDAFDMSQEAFLKAWRSLESFRGDSKFSVWLYRLTTNVCLDFLRKRKRTAAVSLSCETEEGDEEEIQIPDERYTPEGELEKRELRETVRRGLAMLPEESRQILLLREIGGLSYDEIGASLSLEEGTVKSRLFRARKKLCAILMESGNISEYLPSMSTEGV